MRQPALNRLPDLPKSEYWSLIYDLGLDLEDRSARLKDSTGQLEVALAEIATLKEQLGQPKKTSENASLPPSTQVKPKHDEYASGQKRGGKSGHVGKSRVLRQADVIVECEPELCACCGADLADIPRHRVGCTRIWEIPKPEPMLMELQRFERHCDCGHTQTDSYPEGYDPHQDFGPGIHALISYFNGTHHVAQDRLIQMMHDVFGMKISAGAIVNSLQRTAGRLETPVQAILEQIRASEVVGSDETGLRMNGKNGWMWVVQTGDYSYFTAVDTRAARVLEQILGDAVIPVWCSDLYAGQLKANALRFAICNAHQLRNLQYAVDAGDQCFSPMMQTLLRRGLHLTRQRDEMTASTYQDAVDEIKSLAHLLIDIPTEHKDAKRLQKRFRKHFDSIWLFLDRDDVPFDNNASERALRPAVIHRKVIGGFRTSAGAEAYARYRTIEDTARKQKVPVLQALYDTLGQPLQLPQ
jgi:transposase